MTTDTENPLTEDEKGNIVTTAVWRWLQMQKAIKFVPWVLNPDSDRFDKCKAARQDEKDKLLGSLELRIMDTITEIHNR